MTVLNKSSRNGNAYHCSTFADPFCVVTVGCNRVGNLPLHTVACLKGATTTLAATLVELGWELWLPEVSRSPQRQPPGAESPWSAKA